MLNKSLIAAALLAASTGVFADGGTRVYGSVVIADPNFSMAITSTPHYPGSYYAWAPPPPRYYYAPRYVYRYKHRHRHHDDDRYGDDWNGRGDYGHGGRR